MQLRKNGASSKDDKDRRSVENSAKTLLANIRFMSVDAPIRSVVITSTIPNEGKTFVATNLARAMATSGIRTLLVECDMRRRSVANTLNIHARYGLYSVVAGEVSLTDAVVPTGTHRLHFLDAEPHIPNPSDLLSSRRFSALIEEAKKEFGYVVFDTPPVGTFVDAAVLGSKADAVFMVVREQFTRKDDVARAAEQLKTANVPLSGVVMNFCETSSNGYYYYDYYYREGNDDNSSAPRHSFSNDAGQGGSVSPYDAGAHASPRSWNNAPDVAAAQDESQAVPVQVELGSASAASTRRPRFSTGGQAAEQQVAQASDSADETLAFRRQDLRQRIDDGS